VSGDFYDFYESRGILEGVSLFDVSGHGVSAGLITMIAASTVRHVFREWSDAPLNLVMGRINEMIRREIGHVDNFLTGTLLRFRDFDVEYANAGHTQLLCRRGNGGPVSIINREGEDFRGPLLGIRDMDASFDLVTFSVSPGDQILIYTDALVETMDAGKRHFGQDRLIESFRNAPDGNPRDIADHLVADAERHMDGMPWRDDLSIILLKRMI
jgi:phosphoserine phosphatase RsbU/P